jgi:hypothetical protein
MRMKRKNKENCKEMNGSKGPFFVAKLFAAFVELKWTIIHEITKVSTNKK